jgi:hypothetical protein
LKDPTIQYKADQAHVQLIQIVKKIVSDFSRALKQNPMLAVESLFRWQTRDTKESILNNYDTMTDTWDRQAAQRKEDEENMARYLMDHDEADEK